jgi:hypothetical protein
MQARYLLLTVRYTLVIEAARTPQADTINQLLKRDNARKAGSIDLRQVRHLHSSACSEVLAAHLEAQCIGCRGRASRTADGPHNLLETLVMVSFFRPGRTAISAAPFRPATRSARLPSRKLQCDAASLQFVRGVDEPSVPEVKLMRSRTGGNGSAMFVFDNPSIFQASSNIGEITGLFMVDDEVSNH